MPFAGAAQGYKITARQLAAAITPKTRLVLLNSPCNPTGAAYTRAELRALGEVLLEHPRIVIGTDDMYEKIYWGAGAILQPGDRRAGALQPHRDHQRRIEGLRHDRLAHRLLRRTQGAHHRHGHHPGAVDVERLEHLAEGGTVALWRVTRPASRKMNEAFKQRHDFVVSALNALPGVSCLPGAGTFYAFADVSKAMAALGCATTASSRSCCSTKAASRSCRVPASARRATSASPSPAACRHSRRRSSASGACWPAGARWRRAPEGIRDAMAWRILADLLVVLHLAFAAFVVFGGFLAWKWRWAIFAHLPALAWGFWVETSGQICPLTPLENHCAISPARPDTRAAFSSTTCSRSSIRPGSRRRISGCSRRCCS